LKPIADILKALSDETRLRMINLLYEKEELCVCDFTEVLQITQTKASRHLAYLKNANIVSDRKQAQWVFYRLLRNNKNQFLDILVEDNLRKERQYVSDLLNLEKWFNSDTRNNV
jgi:DNA-binding transcriptional ArsR family regulator